MSKQETFEKAVKGIIAQGGASASGCTSSCRYRGENGRKCAAGQLIPDDKYAEDMEGHDVFYRPVFDVLMAEGHDVGFVNEIQRAHDASAFALGGPVPTDGEFLARFKDQAKAIASLHGLDASFLQEGV